MLYECDLFIAYISTAQLVILIEHIAPLLFVRVYQVLFVSIYFVL